MEKTKFVIDNDKKADWTITQIKGAEAERDRLITLAQDQIAELQDRIEELKNKCDIETAYLKSLLNQYFRTVPHKKTETQETYKLLSGTLVMKKPSFKIVHDDESLINSLDGTDFVETKKSLKWGEYKKNLTVMGEDVVDQSTGEIVNGCTVEEVPASFNIKY